LEQVSRLDALPVARLKVMIAVSENHLLASSFLRYQLTSTRKERFSGKWLMLWLTITICCWHQTASTSYS